MHLHRTYHLAMLTRKIQRLLHQFPCTKACAVSTLLHTYSYIIGVIRIYIGLTNVRVNSGKLILIPTMSCTIGKSYKTQVFPYIIDSQCSTRPCFFLSCCETRMQGRYCCLTHRNHSGTREND